MSSENSASPTRLVTNLAIGLLTLWFDLPIPVKGLISVIMVLLCLSEISPRFRLKMPAPAYLVTVLAFVAVSSAGFYLSMLPRGGLVTAQRIIPFSPVQVVLLGFIYSTAVGVPLLWLPDHLRKDLLHPKDAPPAKGDFDRAFMTAWEGCGIQFAGFLVLSFIGIVAEMIYGKDAPLLDTVWTGGACGLGGPALVLWSALHPGPQQEIGLGTIAGALLTPIPVGIQNACLYAFGRWVAAKADQLSRR